MKVGTRRVVPVSMKLYVWESHRERKVCLLTPLQALEYGEIKGMADRAALFKCDKFTYLLCVLDTDYIPGWS